MHTTVLCVFMLLKSVIKIKWYTHRLRSYLVIKFVYNYHNIQYAISVSLVLKDILKVYLINIVYINIICQYQIVIFKHSNV